MIDYSAITYIYILQDPITNVVLYVGQSQSPKARFNAHNTMNCKTKIGLYIKGLKSKRLTPVFTIIDSCITKDVKLLESAYMYLFKGWGFELLNQRWQHTKQTELYK